MTPPLIRADATELIAAQRIQQLRRSEPDKFNQQGAEGHDIE